MEVNITEKDNEITINLSGTLNIFYVNDFYNLIKEKWNTYEKIHVNLVNIDDIDFSVIQLLYSIKKTAEHEEKKVEILIDQNKFKDKFQLLGINIDYIFPNKSS